MSTRARVTKGILVDWNFYGNLSDLALSISLVRAVAARPIPRAASGPAAGTSILRSPTGGSTAGRSTISAGRSRGWFSARTRPNLRRTGLSNG